MTFTRIGAKYGFQEDTEEAAQVDPMAGFRKPPNVVKEDGKRFSLQT